MLYRVEVLGGMFVLGRVAATHMAAFQAQAKMDPGIAQLNAFRTDVNLSSFNFYGIEVSAFRCHDFFSLAFQRFAVPFA